MAMPTRLILLLSLACLLTGCASRSPNASGIGGRFVTEPGAYAAAFDIARDELAGMGFAINRVDAYSGVISTRPKASGGLATPWDREQASFQSEIADLMHPQQRLVRISFIPESAVSRIPTDEPVTQITGEGAPISIEETSRTEPIVGVIEVVIERVYRPYTRVSRVNVLSTSQTRDPSLQRRGMERSFTVVTQRDHALEDKLASRIASRLQRETHGSPSVGLQD